MDRFAAGMATAILSICGVISIRAMAQTGPTERPKVVLVELFTSEGCSSCPPADALLRKVNGTQPAAGQLVVGISEHVTYWNSLGWTDPFSAASFTERQNAYGNAFGLDSVYTPQMVVNGTVQFVGSDEQRLTAAIEKAAHADSPLAVRIDSARLEGDAVAVRFSTVGNAALSGADIVAVIADDADQSSVLRGENSGRRLAHVSVARSLARVAKLEVGAPQTVRIAVPSGFKAAQAHHVILFAQVAGTRRVLGADSRPL